MIRTFSARIDVLRNNVKYTELQPTDMPTIRMNSESEIKGSLQGTFIPNDKVDWLRDELQPVAVINGAEHNFGIYSPTTVTRKNDAGKHTVSIEAYDRCWQVQALKTESIVHFAAGTNYLAAVDSLLALVGISLISATPTDEVLRQDREDWDIGTSYLTIINQLLDEINYNSLWFNANGYAMLTPDYNLSSGRISRLYNASDIKSLMINKFNSKFDLYNAPNVFLCICDNPDTGEIWTARSEITDLTSPLCIERRGKQIMEVVKLDNIASQTALQNYADILCFESTYKSEVVTIYTAIIPDCGVNDIVALTHPDINGFCYETGWSIRLGAGGQMTHTLKLQPQILRS